jgi:hypothetical protein
VGDGNKFNKLMEFVFNRFGLMLFRKQFEAVPAKFVVLAGQAAVPNASAFNPEL